MCTSCTMPSHRRWNINTRLAPGPAMAWTRSVVTNKKPLLWLLHEMLVRYKLKQLNSTQWRSIIVRTFLSVAADWHWDQITPVRLQGRTRPALHTNINTSCVEIRASLTDCCYDATKGDKDVLSRAWPAGGAASETETTFLFWKPVNQCYVTWWLHSN